LTGQLDDEWETTKRVVMVTTTQNQSLTMDEKSLVTIRMKMKMKMAVVVHSTQYRPQGDLEAETSTLLNVRYELPMSARLQSVRALMHVMMTMVMIMKIAVVLIVKKTVTASVASVVVVAMKMEEMMEVEVAMNSVNAVMI